MTQQIIASLNAIPLADMTLEDQQVFAEAVALLSAQAREIERLREALSEIDALSFDKEGEHYEWDKQDLCEAMEAISRKARAALQTQAGGE